MTPDLEQIKAALREWVTITEADEMAPTVAALMEQYAADLRAEVATTKTAYEALVKVGQQLSDKLAAAEAEVASLRAEIESLRTQDVAWSEQNTSLYNDYAAAWNRAVNAEAEVDRLRQINPQYDLAYLHAEQARREAADSEVEAMREAYASLQGVTAAAHARADMAERARDACNSYAATLLAEVDRLTAENALLSDPIAMENLNGSVELVELEPTSVFARAVEAEAVIARVEALLPSHPDGETGLYGYGHDSLSDCYGVAAVSVVDLRAALSKEER